MPPLTKIGCLSLPGQPALDGIWWAPMGPLLFQALYLHCTVSTNSQAWGTSPPSLQRKDWDTERSNDWLRRNSQEAACLLSPLVDILPQNGVLKFSVGFHFTEFENLCLGGVGMRFVTESSRSTEPQLSGGKQHSNRPSAEVYPPTHCNTGGWAAPDPGFSGLELATDRWTAFLPCHQNPHCKGMKLDPYLTR